MRSAAKLLFCSIGLFMVPTADAQTPRRAAEKAAPGELVLATYPVADIVLEVADYPYHGGGLSRKAAPAGGGGGGGFGGGGGGGGGGGMFSVPDPDFPPASAIKARVPVRTIQFGGGGRDQGNNPVGGGITIDALVDSILQCVAPTSWAENGGGEAQITVLGSMLVVSQTPDVHRQIEQFLAMVRRNAGSRQTVAIDARWLMLNSDELDRLAPATEAAGITTVDPKVLEEFTRRPTSLRAITNCFSGQLIHVASGTEKSVVSSWIPVVGSVDWGSPDEMLAGGRVPVRFVNETFGGRAAAVGYQPILTNLNLGVVLEIRPVVVANENSAIVDLSSTLTFADKAQQAPAPVGSEMTPQVDRLAIETVRLATTIGVPLGKPVLVGGLTYSPVSAISMRPGVDGEPRGEMPQVYLVLRVR